MEIIAKNTNDLAPKVYSYLSSKGIPATSRNGPVLMAPEPVTICLLKPWQMVNTTPGRKSNPFFHVMESMAMLAGFNDVDFLSHFAKRMATFSDNGITFNAFYGSRARTTWGDQLGKAIEELSRDPASRRVVVNLWDVADLDRVTKDKACNLSMLFYRTPDGCLGMTTFNRSNDAIWGGVTGANVVHFPYFQMYVANSLGWAQGPWWHVSNNLHVYTENPQWDRLKDAKNLFDIYDVETTFSQDLFGPSQRGEFDSWIQLLLGKMMKILHDPDKRILLSDFQTMVECPTYLSQIVVPMFNAWQCHKFNRQMASAWITSMPNRDWKHACLKWLEEHPKTPTNESSQTT